MYKVCLTSFSNEYAKDVIVTWVASSVKMFLAVLFTTFKNKWTQTTSPYIS